MTNHIRNIHEKSSSGSHSSRSSKRPRVSRVKPKETPRLGNDEDKRGGTVDVLASELDTEAGQTTFTNFN